MYKSAFEFGDVNVEALKKASDLCDRGDYKSAIEVLAECPAESALDYVTFYLRGRANFGRGSREQALEDFDKALMRLKYQQGLVESAKAEPHIADQKWDEAILAANNSINHMESLAWPGRWIPHLYLAIALAADNKEGAKAALRKMMEVEPRPKKSDRAPDFVLNHPLLSEVFKANDELKNELDDWVN